MQNRITGTVTTKEKIQNDFSGFSYKIGDNLKIDLLPRRLSLTLRGDYSRKADTEKDVETDSLGRVTGLPGTTHTITESFEGELKYTVTARISCDLMGRYESGYDETVSSNENYDALIGAFHVTYLF